MPNDHIKQADERLRRAAQNNFIDYPTDLQMLFDALAADRQTLADAYLSNTAENSGIKVNLARHRDLLQLCYNAFKTLQEHGCEIRLGDESATVRIKKELAHDPY